MPTRSKNSPPGIESEDDGFGARTIARDEGRLDVISAQGTDVSVGTVVSPTEIPMHEPACAGEVMTERVATAGPGTGLVKIAALMRDQNVGIVPIVDADRRVLGVITDRDIVVRVDANAASPADVLAENVMTTDPVTVRPEDDLHDVIDRMGDEGLQRVLVVDDLGRLVGIISISDLAQRTDLPERVQDTLDQIARHRT